VAAGEAPTPPAGDARIARRECPLPRGPTGSGRPWSSKSLKQCYQQAAEKFGWAKRDPEPRSMRDGRQLVGYGMATASWPTHRRPSSARVTLNPGGTATVRTGSADIGPGTYTVLTQIAAEVLGLPAEKVRVELADSRLPKAPV
jgi:xanthine dehydrogenase YagR molybdenum-binding subunit